uniref:Serine/threonine-protein kinase PBS1 n=2 Tax=Triticinae TaxID=1648030 RepID=N1R4Z8_AEGTA
MLPPYILLDVDIYGSNPRQLLESHAPATASDGTSALYFLSVVRAKTAGDYRERRSVPGGFWRSDRAPVPLVSEAIQGTRRTFFYTELGSHSHGEKIGTGFMMQELILVGEEEARQGGDGLTLCKIYVSPHGGRDAPGIANSINKRKIGEQGVASSSKRRKMVAGAASFSPAPVRAASAPAPALRPAPALPASRLHLLGACGIHLPERSQAIARSGDRQVPPHGTGEYLEAYNLRSCGDSGWDKANFRLHQFGPLREEDAGNRKFSRYLKPCSGYPSPVIHLSGDKCGDIRLPERSLPRCIKVAIKVLNPNGLHGNKEFCTGAMALSRIYHPNLLKLGGFCTDDNQRILIYEYMPLGSLEKHIFDLSPHKKALDWNTRINILAGAAEGLKHLHVNCNPAEIHGDVKSGNILLGEGCHPKLSNFGLAKLGPPGDNTHVPTRVMGTSGYCAPEYLESGELTIKSDVFSFGVVIVEVITGRNALGWSLTRAEPTLAEWATPLTRRNDFTKYADPALGNKYNKKSLLQVVHSPSSTSGMELITGELIFFGTIGFVIDDSTRIAEALLDVDSLPACGVTHYRVDDSGVLYRQPSGPYQAAGGPAVRHHQKRSGKGNRNTNDGNATGHEGGEERVGNGTRGGATYLTQEQIAVWA